MNTILKIEPMTAAQMAACLEACSRAGRPQKGTSVVLNDGSKWVYDARFYQWACTQRAPE